MAERKKSFSSTHDQTPERRAKRARLTWSPSQSMSGNSSSSHSRDSGPMRTEVKDLAAPSIKDCNGDMVAPTTSTSRLPELLDLSSVSDHRDIAFRFGEIARSLIHDHVLVVSSQNRRAEYEVLEIEFYLRKEGHEDPFAHAAPEQSEYGKWYFHRAPRRSADPKRSATSLTGYRGGTRKGVDLTFGGPVLSSFFARELKQASSPGTNSCPHGGILFRSLRRIPSGVIISGPSLFVDELLSVCGAATVAELVEGALAKDTSAFPSATSTPPKKASISIRPRTTALVKKPTVYSSPRIGLDLSHPGTTASLSDPRVVFVQRPYRYFLAPDLLTANGRPQTFLGIYNLISDAEILNESGVLDEVARLTGLKSASVGKYAADFREGRESWKIESFIGSAGKGASSSPSTYLKMMGTLARLSAPQAH